MDVKLLPGKFSQTVNVASQQVTHEGKVHGAFVSLNSDLCLTFATIKFLIKRTKSLNLDVSRSKSKPRCFAIVFVQSVEARR